MNAMNEPDLVPNDYRELIKLRSGVVRFGQAAVAVVIVLVLAKTALAYGVRLQTREVERMREAEALAIDHRGKIERLREEQRRLQEQLSILETLRAGVAGRQMFAAVDRAMDGSLWLLDWKFRRAGELVEAPPDTVNTGYFIVVPQLSDDEPERAWRMATHMELRGQALGHSALADFTRRLVQQPEIEDVRIIDTRVRQYTEAQVVDFELAVVVRSASS